MKFKLIGKTVKFLKHLYMKVLRNGNMIHGSFSFWDDVHHVRQQIQKDEKTDRSVSDDKKRRYLI